MCLDGTSLPISLISRPMTYINILAGILTSPFANVSRLCSRNTESGTPNSSLGLKSSLSLEFQSSDIQMYMN